MASITSFLESVSRVPREEVLNFYRRMGVSVNHRFTEEIQNDFNRRYKEDVEFKSVKCSNYRRYNKIFNGDYSSKDFK